MSDKEYTGMQQDYTDLLCKFAYELEYDQLPDLVIERTKMFIADYYAASLAGYRINKTFNNAVLNIIKTQAGVEEAGILFEKEKYPVTEAAYMNAVYAHGADMDDGNRNSAGHIGAHVISAVFALAEKLKSEWKDVILSINIGYEFFNRIVGAAQPDLYNKGFHSTGIGGAIACAAACAKLLHLERDEIYSSVSLAAVQSSGLIIIDESGQGCKPVNAANAARCGIMSALISAGKIRAPKKPLESNKGWFHAFAGKVNQDYLVNGLGNGFTISQSYLKLYPTCRHTHCCIDAAILIREQLMRQYINFDFSQITMIKIYIYPSAIRSAGNIQWPNTSEEAKFSICYDVAVALYKGCFKLSDLEPYSDNLIEELSRKVLLFPDISKEDRNKGIRGCTMQVILKDGMEYLNTVEVPKGEGAYALGWEDISAKLEDCAMGTDIQKNVDYIIDKCKKMDVESCFERYI